jgi:predicted PurR-regulated permease PerM
VLTAFLLSSGPSLGQAALDQIPDAERRAQVRDVARRAFTNGRAYVLFALGRATVAGFAAWALCYWEEVPAPIVLGVAVAGLSVVPGFGIVFGGCFALLLEAGLGTQDGVMRLALGFLALQVADVFFTRRVVAPRSLVVGPAPIVISVILGFEVYGIGGAVYAAAVAIFGVALLDAAGGQWTKRPDSVSPDSPAAPEPAEPVPAGSTGSARDSV